MKMLQIRTNNFKQKTEENLHLRKPREYQIKWSQHQSTPRSNRHKWFLNPTLGS